jgi:site-specific DNA-methyltransferase (adenine-specific)
MKVEEPKVLNIDCMEFMRQYPDKFFDLAVVDPPYGIGMDNQKVRTKPNRPNTYLRKGQSQYLGGGWDKERPNYEYFETLFRVSKNQIIWGANYFCEFLPSGYGWIFWDKLMGENQFSPGEFAFQSMQVKSAKFSYPSMRVQNTRIHPTQKPVKLYDWIFQNYAKPNDKILDTHLGSGSSRIAADKNKLQFWACELDKEYFEAQEKRFNNYKSQLTLF